MLIEHGADPHKKNILAVSPIALAPENNRRHIAELRKAFQSKVFISLSYFFSLSLSLSLSLSFVYSLSPFIDIQY